MAFACLMMSADGPSAKLAERFIEVRSPGHGAPDLLTLSSSQFDPYATYDPRPVLLEIGLKSGSLAKDLPHARGLSPALA